MTVKPHSGSIRTKKDFGDFQLHLEWSAPTEIVGESQGRGNSGVFMQGMYEVQILDNYQNETYANGQAGSIYKQTPPLVNACQKPGKWNTYDIIYTAPRFKEDGSLQSHGRITVLHNGVLVQNNTMILGTTEFIGFPRIVAHGKGPIILQDHLNPGAFPQYLDPRTVIRRTYRAKGGGFRLPFAIFRNHLNVNLMYRKTILKAALLLACVVCFPVCPAPADRSGR